MDIQHIKDKTRALYLTEPEEVKQQVWEFAKTAKRKEKGVALEINTGEIWASGQTEKLVTCGSPQRQLTHFVRNIENLVVVVNKFMVGLQKVTGWLFSLLAGGPSPLLQGEIDVYR